MQLKLVYVLCVVTLASCSTAKYASYNKKAEGWKQNKPSTDKKLIHTLYLVGDTGELDDHMEKKNDVLEVMEDDLKDANKNTSLVFLGDNIYPYGLPNKKAEDRQEAEDIIDAQLKLAKKHKGTTYFIPGNHDWNKHKAGGRKAILRQEAYVEEYAKKKDLDIKFYPKNACADPQVVKINKDLVFIFIDSQWWLHDWSLENKINKGCDIKSRGDFLKVLEEKFTEHKNDEIVLLMHHPLRTDGTHGGYFSLDHHLFPLREINEKLWMPLPILGSLYPIYRRVSGSEQDLTHIHNKELIHGIEELIEKLKVNILVAAGHDHGIQYFDLGKLKHIVSGAGGKVDYIRSGGEAEFAVSKRGYAKVDFYEDFEAWAEFYALDEEGNSELAYRTQIRLPRPGTVEEEIRYPKVKESTKLIAANKAFAAGPVKEFFLGSQYRDMWATPVTAEIIDLESKLGGLTPIKKGGGMASNSLRMKLKDKRHYILRSIKKDYTKLVPPQFTNLKILDILEDQNSASHPYNALVIPRLSQAAGIYYTTPKLVYLQHQRGLGNYNSQFPEELYLLEERPSGDWSKAEQFGHSDEIIGYTDLLDRLADKKNHFIDQAWVLKSRIFDLLIHDWDRHDDQWRWAKFEENGKNVYRPIPRDRDQAFYKFVGVIPTYIATFVKRNFKTMKGDLRDVKNQVYNARHFDRYFLNDLEWKEWETIIITMQNDITDQDIDITMQGFPKEIMTLKYDEELGQLLRERRDNLMKIGRRLYDYLSKEVEITGSNNDNRFLVKRYDNGQVNVRYFEFSKTLGELEKYNRTFYPSETKELRLYGLRGEDSFDLSGANNSKIRIRIIGGEDDDKVVNSTSANNIYVYDEPSGIRTTGIVTDKTSYDLDINEYDRNAFAYDTNFPFVSIGNTVDDGWWFGGSLNWVRYGWRRAPYKSKNDLAISFAPGSRNTLQLEFESHLPDRLGKLDFAPRVDISFPHYENFFGLGNQSTYNLSLPIEFNWVRMQNAIVEPLLRANLGQYTQIDFGPTYQYRKVISTAGRVSEDAQLGIDEDAFDARSYVGGKMNFSIDVVDRLTFPTYGFKFDAQFLTLHEIAKDEVVRSLDFTTSAYFKLLNKPKLVLASQAGYHKTYGDRQFYHYPGIGNLRGLRGFRNERFRGESALYHNIDLRLAMFSWNNQYLPMDIGLLGGFDYGRVNVPNEVFDQWHNSRTVGLWFEILGAIVVQPYYSFNEEQNTFSLLTGFNF